MTLYQRLLEAGCKLDSHESDLYVEATTTALGIIKSYAEHGCDVKPKSFISQIDGKRWLDLPFMYEPWWASRIKAAQ